MIRKICFLLVLFATFFWGLGAASTFVTIGGTGIEITQPEDSGPAMTQARIRGYNFFGTDDVPAQAVYGSPEDVETLINSQGVPEFEGTIYIAYSVKILDDLILDTQQIVDIGEAMATSMSEELGGVMDDPIDPVKTSFLGEYWEADFGRGYAIRFTSVKSGVSMLWIINTILVKGKMLGLLVVQNYTDTASRDALQNATTKWATEIYVANGGTLPDEKEIYEQAYTELRDVHPATAPIPDSGSEERHVQFVPYEDPPVIIGNLAPVYPDAAKRARIQGMVILEVEVYNDGTVGEIRVMRSVQAGPGGLDEAAIAAVRKVRFQPARSGGKSVNSTVIIPIEFKL